MTMTNDAHGRRLLSGWRAWSRDQPDSLVATSGRQPGCGILSGAATAAMTISPCATSRRRRHGVPVHRSGRTVFRRRQQPHLNCNGNGAANGMNPGLRVPTFSAAAARATSFGSSVKAEGRTGLMAADGADRAFRVRVTIDSLRRHGEPTISRTWIPGRPNGLAGLLHGQRPPRDGATATTATWTATAAMTS